MYCTYSKGKIKKKKLEEKPSLIPKKISEKIREKITYAPNSQMEKLLLQILFGPTSYASMYMLCQYVTSRLKKIQQVISCFTKISVHVRAPSRPLKRECHSDQGQTTAITQPNCPSSQEGGRVTDPCSAILHKLRLAEFWLGKKSSQPAPQEHEMRVG